jgi:transcriptional regulator with XRE-family HTH domain
MVNALLLRTLMRKARVTQKQLAKLLGIDVTTMRRKIYEHGFSADEAATITAVLEIEEPEKVFLQFAKPRT